MTEIWVAYHYLNPRVWRKITAETYTELLEKLKKQDTPLRVVIGRKNVNPNYRFNKLQTQRNLKTAENLQHTKNRNL